MRQPGIDIRPIVQITGHSEFNETFLDGARTAAENVVGGVDNGWQVVPILQGAGHRQQTGRPHTRSLGFARLDECQHRPAPAGHDEPLTLADALDEFGEPGLGFGHAQLLLLRQT